MSPAPGSPGTARPPVPEALPLPVVDNHTHLDTTRGGDEPWEVGAALAAAAAVGVTRSVQIGCEPDSARWTVELLDRTEPWARSVVGGVALHPTEATRLQAEGGTALDDALALIDGLARHPRVRVVGETGLDHHWVGPDDVAGRAAQEESFRAHIEMAKRHDRTLQIHDRDAHADVLRVLADAGAPERTVFHCFSGDAAMARECASRGWYLSFAGTLTFRNADGLRRALLEVPPEQVLVETDAPYLAPHPHRGRTNAGYLTPLTVRCIAEVTGRPLERVCADLDRTSELVHGPW